MAVFTLKEPKASWLLTRWFICFEFMPAKNLRIQFNRFVFAAIVILSWDNLECCGLISEDKTNRVC